MICAKCYSSFALSCHVFICTKEPIKMGKFIKIYLKTRFQSESRCLLKKAFLLEVNYQRRS